jgi:predicted AAA+ superfamily ATPase
LSESLAGRVGMLELQGFSHQERLGREGKSWLNTWLDSTGQGADAAIEALASYSSAEISATKWIWRGAFPEVQDLKEPVVSGWMQGYVSTSLQRDVRRVMDVRDETQFAAFLGLCAALTAQEVNRSQLGREVGLSSPTAKQWLSALRSTYQWLEVPPLSGNVLKRVSGRPKGYLTDTGLACYLMRLSSPEAVQGHPAFGALFETGVVLECCRQLQVRSMVPALYHYRQHSGAEVDLVVEKDGRFFPVEIKASSQVRPTDARSLATLRRNLSAPVEAGLIIYAGSELLKLDEQTVAVPFDLV